MKLSSIILFAVVIYLSNAACPNGWELNNNNCYFLSNTMYLNWNDASNFCTSINGNLTSVKTQAEYDFLKSFAVGTSPLYPVWIGLHRDPSISSYARWIWLDDGTPANGAFFNQNTRQSDGCISWRTVTPNDGFETITCIFEQPFICKTASV